MLEAKFFDISDEIDTEYPKNGYVKMDKNQFSEKIKIYLESNNEIKDGDIIFIGSHYETRQDYGFGIVINKNLILCDYGPNLPLKYKNNIPNNIRYSNLLKQMNEYKYWDLLWYGDEMDAYEEIVKIYKKENIY